VGGVYYTILLESGVEKQTVADRLKRVHPSIIFPSNGEVSYLMEPLAPSNGEVLLVGDAVEYHRQSVTEFVAAKIELGTVVAVHDHDTVGGVYYTILLESGVEKQTVADRLKRVHPSIISPSNGEVPMVGETVENRWHLWPVLDEDLKGEVLMAGEADAAEARAPGAAAATDSGAVEARAAGAAAAADWLSWLKQSTRVSTAPPSQFTSRFGLALLTIYLGSLVVMCTSRVLMPWSLATMMSKPAPSTTISRYLPLALAPSSGLHLRLSTGVCAAKPSRHPISTAILFDAHKNQSSIQPPQQPSCWEYSNTTSIHSDVPSPQLFHQRSCRLWALLVLAWHPVHTTIIMRGQPQRAPRAFNVQIQTCRTNHLGQDSSLGQNSLIRSGKIQIFIRLPGAPTLCRWFRRTAKSIEVMYGACEFQDTLSLSHAHTLIRTNIHPHTHTHTHR
jgi:hypothetical protein